MGDSVNHPDHYTVGDIECIDAIKASMSKEAFRGYLKATAMKYLWRYEHKHNPLVDVRKGLWFLNRLREELDGSDNG